MLDDISELFDELKSRLVQIQVDGHVDGDSETSTGTKRTEMISGITD
jgi:hypothetical protein